MWTLDAGAGVPLWRPAAPDPAFVLAFSARRGGTSAPPFDTLNLGRSTADAAAAVAENRRRLLGALGLDPARLATAGQVHGAAVVAVRGPGHHHACDALVTRAPGVPLAVSTADCMPLLYTAPGAVAAAHAGWRGTASGMPVAALAALCDAAGVPPARVRVAIGPCIRPCCYEVGPEVAGRFPAAAVRDAEGSLRLDLAVAARLQLLEAGVPEDAIEDTGACTSCEPFWYFSHRRDAGATGRHWGVAALLA
ncbi:MAG: laccase domain-containing protein [Candidatus Eisenbacteria bacterium]|nr:laccase domain-containing protein [Candidatus Eisenbacteria bacterium]